MNLFRKELIIHESRLSGSYKRIESNKALIEHLFKDGVQRFPHMIFRGDPSQCSKETQLNPSDKDDFLSTSGEYTIVETPGDPLTLAVASIVLTVAATAYAFYVANKYSADTSDTTTASSNRSLTQRQNKERPMERIEDIAGQVRSFSTLIGVDYRKFDDDTKREIEYSLMCVGVGEHDISDIQDDETLISSIDGAGACFYGPNVMPGNSSNAFVTAGDAFDETVKLVRKSSSASGGELLETSRDRTYFLDSGAGTITRIESSPGSGVYWGKIISTDEAVDMTEYTDDTLTSFITLEADVSPANLDGAYRVQSVSSYEIIISGGSNTDVNTINPNWDLLTVDTAYTLTEDSAFLDSGWVGDTYLTYFLPQANIDGFWFNVIAAAGLQKNSGSSVSIECEVDYAEANSSGTQTGPWVSAGTISITGRTANRIGKTGEFFVGIDGPIKVRIRRVTSYIEDAVQDLYLDALYSTEPIGVTDFGNVTTVQTKTIAKGTAANLSTRYFNCLATRKIPTIQSDGSLSAGNEATKRFIDYLAYATTSDAIGRRDSEEFDYQEEYDQHQDIITYFGDTQAGEFCYTFDDNDISYQDTADLICGACFSVPIRKNGVISSKFEKPGEPRTLFNHRNKIPDSQTITRTFINDDYTDGIEYQWVDPGNDDSISTIYIPDDLSATRPEKIESVGVRNYAQAYWNAYRRYNKINNQRVSLQDTVTAEGQLLSQIDIAAVTDDTKANIYAGEIVGVSGLTLYLNQPVEFTDGETHSISLRLRDGSVEIIGCAEGTDSMSVILDSSPTETPYTETEEERTRFTFSADSDLGSDYYIISEIDRKNPNEIKIKGYNYTDDFYQNDSDTPVQ